MANRNKQRGNELERALVQEAKEAGLSAIRAWGSNGRALGEAETVDCIVDNVRIQAKRRKKLPEYLQVPEGADIVVFRQDRYEPLALIPYSEWLRLRLLVSKLEDLKKNDDNDKKEPTTTNNP